MAYNYTGVSRVLVNSGLLDAQQTQQAVEEAKQEKLGLIAYVEKKELVKVEKLLPVLGVEFSVPVLDLSSYNLTYASEAVRLVNEELIREKKFLPIFKRGEKLYIAVNDPTGVEIIDQIQFKTRLKVAMVLVSDQALDQP